MTSLDLSCNNLGFNKTGAEIAQALAAIPAGVTSLDLRNNSLGSKTGAEIAEALAAIPAGVTSLDLSENGLGSKTGAEIAEALAAIPTSVTNLNLSQNYLDFRTNAKITHALAGIPAGVTSIILAGNYLEFRSDAKITHALAGIPAGVNSLGLDFNLLFNVNHAIKLDILLGILSSSVTTVVINGHDYNVSDILLNAVFPADKRNSSYWEGHTIKPQCNIDEESLLQFIQYFQKHPSPIHFLTSGLLLQGIIENSVDENSENSVAYFEKRLLLAIDFYRKAACDAELAPKVEHILWNMRIVYHDIPAVIEKLKPYQLKPMIEGYDEFKQDTRENYQELADHSEAEMDISELTNKELNMSTKLAVSGFFGGTVGMGITLAVSPTSLAMVTGALACMPQILAIVAAISICAIAIGLLAYSIGLICETSTCHAANYESRLRGYLE